MKPSMKSTVRRTSVSTVVAIAIMITGLVSCLAAHATEPRLCHNKSVCFPSTWCDGYCDPLCLCPDDYCCKSAPCAACGRGPWCCDDYCHKSAPCLPCTSPCLGCDNYCEKPCPACPPRLCTDVNRFSAAGVSRYAQNDTPIDATLEPRVAPRPQLFFPMPRTETSDLLPLPPVHVPVPTVDMPAPTGPVGSTVRMPTLRGPVR